MREMASVNAFRSERLLYRAIEDTPKDDDFLHSIQANPASYGNSSLGLFKPQAKRDTINGFKKNLIEQHLIAVIICLASTPALAPADSSKAEVENADRKPKPVGVMSLTYSAFMAHHRESYISIDMAAPHQGKGYGSEAIAWVLDWGFDSAGLHRIGIEAFSYNDGAVRLYDRLGFKLEGRKREALWFNGGWHDFLTFGMLDREWRERRREGKGNIELVYRR